MKRLEVKYVRDGIKKLYKKESECYICKSTTELQLHHYTTVTLLWNRWKAKNKITIKTVEDVELYRLKFLEEHNQELLVDVVTLCKSCHMGRLHKVYGKTPSLATATKQKLWVEKQREKHNVAI